VHDASLEDKLVFEITSYSLKKALTVGFNLKQ
jgi:hypothetical protein